LQKYQLFLTCAIAAATFCEVWPMFFLAV